jgi:hypothetical protein
MTTRQYSSRSQQSTLTTAITAGTTSITVVSGSALLGGVTIPAGRTFTLVIDPDTALEEIVDATATSGTNTFTITRAIDGSSAQEHSAGAVVRHMAIGRDYRDANLHTQASASYNDGAGNAQSMHGIASGEGDVVGTLKTQTLTNKTLTSPTISNPTLTGTPLAEASIVFEGATADDHETTLTVVDPTQDNTITLPNTSGTVVIVDATQTLTNKTLTSPTISGSPVITGLSSAGMSATSATPKDYVDSILGSATAASTSAASAATSATSAATSATSAAASATAAATSASSASASATAATTSATSASNSASAAATSATSASNSASAASTSATSAETSATSSATSASAAATSATSAATSATSSATSASAAATSATSAAASATAAATSATSAATSYDQFDDRYLGNKSSDPTLDNDGGALLTGALYFNDVIDAMKVYNGASWDLVAPDTSNFIDKTILTAKGSIISASTASTPVALTVATTDGYILSVSAAATSGLAWIAPNPGDITGVTASSPLTGGGTSGDVTVGIQDGTTAQKGAVQLEDSTASTSTTNAATPNSVKSAYDLANTANTAASSAQTTANAAVPKSTVDAKGDLIVGSADDTVVKLTAGANGLYLAADSSTTSGLVWTTVATTSPDGSVSIPVNSAPTRTLTFSFTTGIYNINFQGPVVSMTVGGVTVTSNQSLTTTLSSHMVSLPSTSSASISLASYWTTRNSGTTSTIQNIAFGSSTYLMSGGGGLQRTSTDAITWTSRTIFLSSANDVPALTFGNSLFVGGNTGGTLASSTDGITWTTRASGWGVNGINVIEYLNSIFLLGGANGIISTSTNGTTWSTRVSDLTLNINAFAFGNSTYVAGGAKGGAGNVGLITSTNLTTWSTRDAQFGTTTINSLAFGNSVFVAGGGAGTIRTSTNGITWTSRTAFTANGVQSMIFDGSLFLATGSTTGFASSTDGITWTIRSASISPTKIFYGNNLYIAAGGSGALSTNTSTIGNTTVEGLLNWNLSPTVALD